MEVYVGLNFVKCKVLTSVFSIISYGFSIIMASVCLNDVSINVGLITKQHNTCEQ